MKISFGRSTATVGILSSMAVLLCLPPVASASSILASAQSFAVLGGQSVTNVPTTNISGSVGVYPGSSIPSTGIVVTNGTLFPAADSIVGQARVDETAAYDYLKGLPADFTPNIPELANLTLTPGVYKFSSGAQLNGRLILDFGGFSNKQFVFQIDSTLITGSGSSVTVRNGTATDGIFWQVGSSATLGTTTTFAGNILALTSISLLNSAKIECGRAFAQNGSVTMDANLISNNCVPANATSPSLDFGSGGFSPNSSGLPVRGNVPEPGTFTLFGISLSLSLAALTLKYSARKK